MDSEQCRALSWHSVSPSQATIDRHFLGPSPTFHAHLQLSNNKEKKKKKKEESNGKEKKPDDSNGEMNIDTSPLQPPHTHQKIPTPFSHSPIDVTPVSTLSIPVPHMGNSITGGLMSPDLSPIYTPQQTQGNLVAHLAQIQHQLQADSQPSSAKKGLQEPMIPVQQQLQSLSQMACTGEEVLITLNINTINPSPAPHNHSFSVYRPPAPTGIPCHLEITAKGFVRMHNTDPSFVRQQRLPSHSICTPPQTPIGPPIRPVLAPPKPTMASNARGRRRNRIPSPSNFHGSSEAVGTRSPIHGAECDHLCQSSLSQPDFRGRPMPGVLGNPYYSHSNPSSWRNVSASNGVLHQPISRTSLSLY